MIWDQRMAVQLRSLISSSFFEFFKGFVILSDARAMVRCWDLLIFFCPCFFPPRWKQSRWRPFCAEVWRYDGLIQTYNFCCKDVVLFVWERQIKRDTLISPHWFRGYWYCSTFEVEAGNWKSSVMWRHFCELHRSFHSFACHSLRCLSELQEMSQIDTLWQLGRCWAALVMSMHGWGWRDVSGGDLYSARVCGQYDMGSLATWYEHGQHRWAMEFWYGFVACFTWHHLTLMAVRVMQVLLSQSGRIQCSDVALLHNDSFTIAATVVAPACHIWPWNMCFLMHALSLSVFFPFFWSFFVCSSYESSSGLLWSTGSSNLRFMLHATFLYTCHLSHTTHCHWLCRHAPLHSEKKRSKLEMKREGNSQANIMATRHTLPFHIELQQSSTPSSSDEKVVASAHRLANHMRF